MKVIREEFRVPSADGVHTLAGVVFRPESQPKGFFQVVHGMTEYIGRYEKFLSAMAEDGWIAFGYDHLGHGNTAYATRDFGYIAAKDGWKLLVRDVKTYSDAVFASFGKTDALPYHLMGHSMGSFIVRLAAAGTVKPDKLIVMGTGGPNPAANAGLVLVSLVKCFCGDRHVSPLLQKVAFGGYNRKFKSEIEQAPDPWLTTDIGVRKAYAADSFCNFKFTVSAMGDLIRLNKYSNAGAWYKALPQTLPVLLVAGEDDPVGNYGKGVQQVEKKLKQSGHRTVCILYAGARHEILNDFTYNDVLRDVKAFSDAT